MLFILEIQLAYLFNDFYLPISESKQSFVKICLVVMDLKTIIKYFSSAIKGLFFRQFKRLPRGGGGGGSVQQVTYRELKFDDAATSTTRC